MATDPDALGAAIDTAVSALSVENKQIALAVWKALAGPVAAAMDAAGGGGAAYYVTTAWGRNGAGLIEGDPIFAHTWLLDTVAGDELVSAAIIGTDGTPGALTAGSSGIATNFESVISVTGQIQQVVGDDLHFYKYLFLLRRTGGGGGGA